MSAHPTRLPVAPPPANAESDRRRVRILELAYEAPDSTICLAHTDETAEATRQLLREGLLRPSPPVDEDLRLYTLTARGQQTARRLSQRRAIQTRFAQAVTVFMLALVAFAVALMVGVRLWR